MSALLQAAAVTVAVHLQDVEVAGEAVKQGSSEPRGTEDFESFPEEKVDGIGVELCS